MRLGILWVPGHSVGRLNSLSGPCWNLFGLLNLLFITFVELNSAMDPGDRRTLYEENQACVGKFSANVVRAEWLR